MSPWMDLNDSDAHEKDVKLGDVLLVRSLWPYIRPHWPFLVASFALLPLVSYSLVIQPVLVRQALDGPIAHRDWAGLLGFVGWFALALAAHYGLRYLQMILAQIMGQRIVLSLRTALYNHLQALPQSFYHRTPLGKLVTRVSSDVENISEVFASGGLAIFADFAVIIGVIVGMFSMNATLASVAVCILPVLIVTVEFFRRRSRRIYNELRVQQAQVNSILQESLTGMDVIRLLRRERHHLQVFEAENQAFTATNVRSVVYDSAFTAAIEVLLYATILLILGAMTWQQLGPASGVVVSIGVLVAFLQYTQMLFEPIEEISDKFTIIQSGLASVEKIMELMAEPVTIQSPPEPVALARAQGEIRFEGVRFGYDAQRPVLKGLSLTIQPGEKVAIIGATGAGKSTLIKLLNRTHDPQAGRILLDGVDLRDYDLSALRRNITVIPQEEFLFSRSLAENITLQYREPVDSVALATITEAVHADAVVQRLGYEAILPERGRNLSNGERQTLVFARALWHDPAIIVLDEATSAIDPQTEGLLQDALDRTLAGRTAIIIAHRLSTIEQVDTLYVIENGEVVESGAPKTLLAQGGSYSRYLGETTKTLKA